jgi:acyl-coenzyme A thioesterase PaaI-like protein
MSMFDFDRPIDANDARLRLAAAARLIITELASSTATDDAFLEACELVESAAAQLRDRPHGRDYEGAEASLMQHADSTFLDFSPFVGTLNPLAPPIAVQIVDGTVTGHVTYSDAYEGPPNCVHGGFIAGGFDEMLGLAQSIPGQPGMTAFLHISYRSPTPLGRPLQYDCRVDRIEGRKISVSGTLHHGDTLCAEAEALFISMKPDVFERLMRSRAVRD